MATVIELSDKKSYLHSEVVILNLAVAICTWDRFYLQCVASRICALHLSPPSPRSPPTPLRSKNACDTLVRILTYQNVVTQHHVLLKMLENSFKALKVKKYGTQYRQQHAFQHALYPFKMLHEIFCLECFPLNIVRAFYEKFHQSAN